MLLPLSDYASLIEPTWLLPRLFDSSRQGALGCSSPPRGRRGGGYGPIRQPARHTPTFPLKKGGGKAESSPVAWQSGITRTVLLLSGGAVPPKKTGPGVSPGPRIRWPCQMLDLTLTNSG